MNSTQTPYAVIMPNCDDSNRGDQALVWQTMAVGRDAGCSGKYYMLATSPEKAAQSAAQGIGVIEPVLHHPRTRYAPKDNVSYTPILTLAWGSIALADTARNLMLLNPVGRRLARRLLSDSQQETIRRIEGAEVCFVKGGGFIHSTNSVTDVYRAYYSLFHVFLAQSLGKPVVVMPNSFGPLKGRLYRRLVRRALRNCVLVTARESISQNALDDLGVDSAVYPDLAFGLQGEGAPDSPVRRVKVENPGKRIVGITVRPYRFPYSEDPKTAQEAYIASVAEFARDLSAQGYVPLFIEHVRSAGKHESDMAAIQQVTSLLKPSEYAVVSVPDYDCRKMKGIYGECDFVVGTRFHSVIFAMSEGVPALAIAYGGNKGTGIMMDIGLSHMAIPIEDFSFDVVKQRFQELVEREEEIRAHLADLSETHRKKYAELAAEIRERVGL